MGKPKNRFQKIENHSMFFAALKAQGVKLVNIGPEDLVSRTPLPASCCYSLPLRWRCAGAALRRRGTVRCHRVPCLAWQVDGNPKLVLGLTWQLINKFEMQKNGTDPEEILAWVRQCTDGYDGVQARVPCHALPARA